MKVLATSLLVIMASASVPAQTQEASATPTTSASASVPEDLQPVLRSLQEAVDAVITSKEGERLFIEFKALRIPEYQAWFLATFGSETEQNSPPIIQRPRRKRETKQ